MPRSFEHVPEHTLPPSAAGGDGRLETVARLLRPAERPVVEDFPPTPTGWAQTVGLSWPDAGDRCVVRLIAQDGPVDEDAAEAVRVEFAAARLLGDAGIAPRVRCALQGSGVLVMDRVDGTPARPASRPQALSLARLLARLHRLEWPEPARLYAAKQRVANRQVRRRSAVWPALGHYRQALACYDALRGALGALAVAPVLCHNDLNPGNILFDAGRAWLVDFDHVGPGDPLFDVATVLRSLALGPGLAEEFLGTYLDRSPTAAERDRLVLLDALVLLRYGLSALSLVPEQDLGAAAETDPGEAFVFERRAGEPLGRSVLRLSLGFTAAGLARAQGPELAGATRRLGVAAALGAGVERALDEVVGHVAAVRG
ncbi:aminoglycoside phosphotransferase (APT) family kinase protein [Streptacidiphilus sp. MAP12-33]|uniref:phosphotransferase n=1 Tax=Streptacidiphilus sp. MAP12-33 TaxID=3156266 RepID=UPI0035120B9E